MARSKRELQAMADMITVETYGQMPRDEAGHVVPTPIPCESCSGCGRPLVEGARCPDCWGEMDAPYRMLI